MDLSKFNATSDTFSDFIVYVDESGDHSLTSIDPEFPVFVLAFCVFHKQHYAQQVVPNVEQLKFGHFGHDLVILHERDIRKRQGDFSTFRNKAEPSAFIDELSAVMTDNNYIIISCVVDKYKLSKQTAKQEHPYHIALKICLERLYEFLIEHNQQNKLTHVVVEKRGRKEDTDLELEFRRICDEDNKFNTHLPFAIRLADKQTNSTGLQFADMVARPIGIHHLKPVQKNRAFEILVEKFLCDGGRKNTGKNYLEHGLNIYPKTWHNQTSSKNQI